MTEQVFRVCDLFCGAGGSSTGAMRAIRAIGGEMDLVAVNHWDTAIATHTRNHPTARHHCVDLDAARPEAIVPEGRLDLLMASPECVFFSRARGGKPVHDQRRMSAWHVNRWARLSGRRRCTNCFAFPTHSPFGASPTAGEGCIGPQRPVAER